MCSTLAEGLKAHVLTVVLRDDVVARLTPQSVRKLMKEVLAFQQRGMAFDQLEQDWGDLVRRAGQIWGPRFRKPTSARSEENKENEEIEGEGDGEKEKEGGRESVVDSEDAEAEDDYVSVEEHDIADLWLPGRVLHIYAHRGRYLPSLVSRSFPTLRSIQVRSRASVARMRQTWISSLAQGGDMFNIKLPAIIYLIVCCSPISCTPSHAHPHHTSHITHRTVLRKYVYRPRYQAYLQRTARSPFRPDTADTICG